MLYSTVSNIFLISSIFNCTYTACLPAHWNPNLSSCRVFPDVSAKYGRVSGPRHCPFCYKVGFKMATKRTERSESSAVYCQRSCQEQSWCKQFAYKWVRANDILIVNLRVKATNEKNILFLFLGTRRALVICLRALDRTPWFGMPDGLWDRRLALKVFSFIHLFWWNIQYKSVPIWSRNISWHDVHTSLNNLYGL